MNTKLYSVVDKILGPLIRQAVECLGHQNLEHQHRIKRWTTTFAAFRTGQGFAHIMPENLKIHSSGERLQLIAKSTQWAQTIINIQETGLFHATPHLGTGTIKSRHL